MIGLRKGNSVSTGLLSPGSRPPTRRMTEGWGGRKATPSCFRGQPSSDASLIGSRTPKLVGVAQPTGNRSDGIDRHVVICDAAQKQWH